MGGTRSQHADDITQAIWHWTLKHKVWLSDTHLPDVSSIRADKLSRSFDQSKEWKLDSNVFGDIVSLWSRPDIDLFASRVNCQIEKYMSWAPDPYDKAVDAFSCDWGHNIYFHLSVY